MKNTMQSLLIFLLSAVSLNAQVTLESKYSTGQAGKALLPLEVVRFSGIGDKYVCGYSSSYTSGTINIYNLNHSLYKSFNIPSLPMAASGLEVLNVSDSLFNTSTADIEYLVQFIDTSGNWDIRVFNDSGSTIFSKDSSIVIPSNTTLEGIYYTSAGYKLMIGEEVGGTDTISYVYKLPGALPCLECTAGILTGIISRNTINNSGYLSSPFPNPNSRATTIKYELPEGVNTGQMIFFDLSGREVKKYNVDHTFSTLELSTSDLASGTYLYILQTTIGNVGTKKMVVIK